MNNQYVIKLYHKGKQVGVERFADQEARENAALRVAKEWRSRADEWHFDVERRVYVP